MSVLNIFKRQSLLRWKCKTLHPASISEKEHCLHAIKTIYCFGAICYCFLDTLPVCATKWVQPLQTAPIFSCEKKRVSIFLGSARKISLLTSCPCLLLPQTYRCPSSTIDKEVKFVESHAEERTMFHSICAFTVCFFLPFLTTRVHTVTS